MYSPNLRSFIRTLIREEVQSWQGDYDYAEITHRVVGRCFTEREMERDEYLEAVYTMVYQEVLVVLKRPPAEDEPLQTNFLHKLGVPKRHATMIVELGMKRVYVPSRHAPVEIFGSNRVTRAELAESIVHYRALIGQYERIVGILTNLYNLPGYYN